MIRKLVSILFATAVVLGMGVTANAAQDGGRIRVSLNFGELPATNGAITLYQVGTPIEGGYRITDIFGGGIVKKEDATSPNLAQWLAESAGDTGRTVNLDVDGNVTFSHLEEGLYLIVQTERTDGFYLISPYLVALAENEEIQTYAPTDPIVTDNPQTGQPFAPFLGAVGMVASGVGLYLCVDSKRRK